MRRAAPCAVRGLTALCGAGALLAAGHVGRAQDVSGGGPAQAALSAEGGQIYKDICQACHLADAKGGGGAGAVIPALAGNPRLADAGYTVGVVVKGRAGMPWFHDMLTPREIAAVVNHVRTHFNDFPGEVSEAEVVAAIAASGVASPD
ncbi:MAG: hypothetical protein B7Z08_08130 [Sphingomonadales bacterium 32-68-7]|nr:MAG: hypothetical protein B7Z33_10250 [Sphingomonadales bacterium 12-68-11]OYX08741.1 MAG: hypothetical protein B7Z08_08130 [Sphingomonadales bacterium 32-68-7]